MKMTKLDDVCISLSLLKHSNRSLQLSPSTSALLSARKAAIRVPALLPYTAMPPHWEGARRRGNISVCHSREQYEHDIQLILRDFDPRKLGAHLCVVLNGLPAHFDSILFFRCAPLYPSSPRSFHLQRSLLADEVIPASSRALSPAFTGNFTLFPRCSRPVAQGGYKYLLFSGLERF